MDPVNYRGAFAPNTDSWLLDWTLIDEYGYIAEMEAMGVAENIELEGRIFPNPVADKLSIELKENADHLTIEFYNLSGKLVKAMEVNNVTERISIDVNDLNSGFHVLNLRTKQTSKSFKIFIR